MPGTKKGFMSEIGGGTAVIAGALLFLGLFITAPILLTKSDKTEKGKANFVAAMTILGIVAFVSVTVYILSGLGFLYKRPHIR